MHKYKETAIIFGAAGQDGTLMSLLLLKKGYRVFALSQTRKFSNFINIKNENLIKKKINYYNFSSIKSLINKSRCIEIYFFAGNSSPKHSLENYVEALKSQVLPVHLILEAIKDLNRNIKFFNAASSEIFKPSKKKLNEDSIKEPLNPYGLAKLNSLLIVKFFRENFKMMCFSGILFNHESKLRSKDFVIPKIIDYLKKKNFSKKLQLGNIDIIKDFGWAPEYVEIIFKLMKKRKYEDFIIATGKSYKLKKIIELIFKEYNLNWKDYVILSKKFKRLNENKFVYANINKIKKLNIKPKVSLINMIKKLNN